MRKCSRLLAMADAAGSTSDAGAPAHGGIGSASASSSAGAGAGAGAGAAAPAAPPTAAPAMGPEPPPGMQPVVATKKGSVEGRLAFQYKGRTVYEWEQNLEEVHVYITPPPGVRAKMLDVSIAPTHLKIGIKGNPPFINEDFAKAVIAAESYWMMEDGELHINCQKTKKGETWPSALKGHGALDPLTQTEVQKKMMLERFQEENPGFDFSGAEFNGAVPDPRAFMGGVKYK